MADGLNQANLDAIEDSLDRLAGAGEAQSNCMFQLALMLARIAIEPGTEDYKEQTAQAMLGMIRNKPRHSVVHLFGAGVPVGQGGVLNRAAG